MTRRARDAALARSLQIDVVLVRDGEDVVPLAGFDGFEDGAL